MTLDSTKSQVNDHRVPLALVMVAFAAICLGPHLHRLGHPSLFTDDVYRIGDLQTKPLKALLFRPFEEHMAPLFEVVSWVTWHLAGQRLVHAPLAFTLMSYVPFVLSLWMLGLLVHRELESLATALVAVAAYCLSSLHAEVVYWYSASSFSWALLFTLVTLLCLAPKARQKGQWNLGWSALAAALAPAFSAIGLLAGPLGVIRVAASSDGTVRRGVRIAALTPVLGTLLYLAVCSVFRYHDVLTSSLEKKVDLGSGLAYALCAPTNVLVPGLFGLSHIALWPPIGLNLAISILCLIAVCIWARRSLHAALIWGGLWLALGGYAMTYCVRTQRFGAPWLFNVGRYHLFPLLGFVFWMAVALRSWMSRFDVRPLRSLVVATVLAASLMVAHLPSMIGHSEFYRFANQRSTLRALERLELVCQRERITRDQVLAALDPISLRWGAPLVLLPESVEAPRLAEARVRAALLASLSPVERESLWGGMDVSPYLKPIDKPEFNSPSSAACRMVGSHRIRSGGAGHFISRGWPSYLEYEIPDRSPGIVDQPPSYKPVVGALCLDGAAPEGPIEVWWTGKEGRWSERRSVRWQPDPARPLPVWTIPLDLLPHWDLASARRIRIVFRTSGTFSIGAPWVLR